MAVRSTLQLGDPALRVPAADVAEPGSPQTAETAADLADTLADWVARTGYGRGIAAPQIGVPSRVIHLHLDRPWTLVNPRIVGRSEETWEPWDACLSFSLQFFCKVGRARWVDVVYRSPDGGRHSLRADGDLGELLQHEIDHLDGIMAVDRMTSPSTLCMRSEFEHRHRDESPYQQ
ncbi:peptide deformylase [Streptomyces sp. B8F3]|uniref:peptide deformylase n=1 Tax=unclassified Streptomyces TaxID=2593676 RepID=UPI00325D80F4